MKHSRYCISLFFFKLIVIFCASEVYAAGSHTTVNVVLPIYRYSFYKYLDKYLSNKVFNNQLTSDLTSSVNDSIKVSNNFKEQPMIAIIIDDVGTDMIDFTELMKIRYPFTLSILPNQRFSKICAQIGNQNGKEIMLHQPMQPKNGEVNHIGQDGIFVTMNEDQIREVLKRNLQGIPFTKGLNNHMGSLATSKKNLMTAFMKELKTFNIYFVDSLTSGSSIAYSIAKENDIPVLQRTIFIDANSGYDYAINQLKKLKSLAKSNNYALAIGHCKPSTIKALLNYLPEIEKDGINIVLISKMMQKWKN